MQTEAPARVAIRALLERRAGVIVPLLLAGGLTLLNCLKPLHIDDSTYYQFARHISENPLDPYEFSIMYFNRPVAANHVLAPPLVPYWWACALRVAGDSPLVWKASLLPFALALTFSTYTLLKRFCPGLHYPLLVFLILSPAFLPAMNLMLDVPVVALCSLAMALIVYACNRDRDRATTWGWAIAAGVVAGLAIQTKYTALLTPVVFLAYTQTSRKFTIGWVASVSAGVTAASWELFLLAQQGESHFLYHAFTSPPQGAGLQQLALALASIMGQTAPFLGLLGLVALRAPLSVVAVGIAATAYGGWGLAHQTPGEQSVLPQVIGGGVLVVVIVCSFRAFRTRESPSGERVGRFLALWFFVELLGYFVLSPFPAVRRTMGLVVSGTMVVGFLLSRGEFTHRHRLLVGSIIAGGVLLAMVYVFIDLLDAEAHRELAERAAAEVRELDPNARMWFCGYWGFQFYAERAGMLHVVPGALVRSPYAAPVLTGWGQFGTIMHLSPSRLDTGDFIVIPAGIPNQVFLVPEGRVVVVKDVILESQVPFTTIGYYGGRSPIAAMGGNRAQARIYRVTAPFVPATPVESPGPAFRPSR